MLSRLHNLFSPFCVHVLEPVSCIKAWDMIFTYMYLCCFRDYNHNIFPCADDGQEKTNDDAPENNPQYTTVYVGNLAPEVSICFIDSLLLFFFDNMGTFLKKSPLSWPLASKTYAQLTQPSITSCHVIQGLHPWWVKP